MNAQGEDVVSGVRTPLDLSEMKDLMPGMHETLLDIMRTLEAHYKDMQDVEFTVEEGRLYMLQTRSAKRPAQAAVRFAVDAVDEGLLTREEALVTIDANRLDALLHPAFGRDAHYDVLAKGVAASPGAAKGEIVFTADEAVAAKRQGRDVILVRPFTEADDVAGFHAARGILTSEGGKASHAALVARGMGVPCVSGAGELHVDLIAHEVRVNGTVLHEGDQIAIDGSKGIVTVDDVDLVEPEVDENFQKILEWSDQIRRLGVHANADTPEDARKAREFGAEGIGLCRTEHMFMAEDRMPKVRAMIMAKTVEDRRRGARPAAAAPAGRLRGPVRGDGRASWSRSACSTRRCTSSCPGSRTRCKEVEHAKYEHSPELADREHTLERVHQLMETNPMLGTRGCRLGLVHPEIYEMQVKAIIRAARAVKERSGDAPDLEIMIPLVAYEKEFLAVRKLVERVIDEEGGAKGLKIRIGTMMELPRACFIANRIARVADFFSFGTNDLTQTALGFSRDDVEGRFLADYMQQRIVDRSPFETIDKPGRGLAREAGGMDRPRDQPQAPHRHLRRARRRSGLDRVLPHGGPRLRELLALPRAHRARGGRPGRAPRPVTSLPR